MRTLFATFLLIVAIAASQSANDDSAFETGRGLLDGLVFVGRIGPDGNPDFDEEISFNNGYFWTRNCMLCGYRPSLYWVRMQGDAIHFQAELSNDEGSTFNYSGRVTGRRIEVKVRWTKRRWYWSIDRLLLFSGTAAPNRTAMSVDEAANNASGALLDRPLPGWCT